MRLWHQGILQYLPDLQVKGQHRECCALRGKGWGKKHSTVDYVFLHPYDNLYQYHILVIQEMVKRGCNVSPEWLQPAYRGKLLGWDFSSFTDCNPSCVGFWAYPEHNERYLLECVKNLFDKGIILNFS